MIAAAPGGRPLGVTSTADPTSELGKGSATASVVRPPSDMPTTAFASGASRAPPRRRRSRCGDARLPSAGPSEWPCPGRSMPPAADSARARPCPGVRVLGAAVQQHQLGRLLTPEQGLSRRPSPSSSPSRTTGGTGVRDAELVGVLAEQRELVVGARDQAIAAACQKPRFGLGFPAHGDHGAAIQGDGACGAGRKLGIAEFGTPDGRPSCGSTARPGPVGRSPRTLEGSPRRGASGSSASTGPAWGCRPRTSTRTSTIRCPTSSWSWTSSAWDRFATIGLRAGLPTPWRRPQGSRTPCRRWACSVGSCRASAPTRRRVDGSASPSGSGRPPDTCATRAASSSPRRPARGGRSAPGHRALRSYHAARGTGRCSPPRRRGDVPRRPHRERRPQHAGLRGRRDPLHSRLGVRTPRDRGAHLVVARRRRQHVPLDHAKWLVPRLQERDALRPPRARATSAGSGSPPRSSTASPPGDLRRRTVRRSPPMTPSRPRPGSHRLVTGASSGIGVHLARELAGPRARRHLVGPPGGAADRPGRGAVRARTACAPR